MQKLKNTVIDHMLEACLTKSEVVFLIHISHYQDNSGRITGLYYKDICKALDISFQTFYDVRRSLEDKQLIRVDKEYYGDWDITILGNSFEDGKYDEGYISTGDDIFFDPDFNKLKAGEILLVLLLLKITKNKKNGGKYRIGVLIFQEKYCKLLNVTIRILQRYLHTLKRFFSVGISKGQYFIRPLKGVGEKIQAPTDIQLFKEHIGAVMFRRQRASGTKEEYQDTIDLISQYADTLMDKITEVFQQAVEESIRLKNAGIANRYKWNRQLNPKFIHKLLLDKIMKLQNFQKKSGKSC